MKYAILLLFLIASTAFAIKNNIQLLNEDQDDEKYQTTFLDEFVDVLKQIKFGLLKDKKYEEIATIEFHLEALDKPIRRLMKKTVDFAFQYKKYWSDEFDQFNELSIENNDEDDEKEKWKNPYFVWIMRLFRGYIVIFETIEQGLIKDKIDQKEVTKANVYKLIHRKYIKPTIHESMRLYEKYDYYVDH